MKEQIPEDIRDHLYALDNNLLEDPIGQSLDLNYECQLADDVTRHLMKGRIFNNLLEQEKYGPFHRPRKLTQGSFCQGFDIKGKEIRFPVQWLMEPKLIIGSTGCGKTTLTRYEILMLASLVTGTGMWLFDLRKIEYGILQSYLARVGTYLNIITGRQMKFNPLQIPKDVDPFAYAANLADALVRVWDAPPVASLLLSQTIIFLYRTFGIFVGGKNYPTMFDLHTAIRKNTGANPQARNAVLVRLEPLLLSLGTVLAYRQGWSTHALAKLCINYQFNDIGERDQNLLLNVLLLQEFMSRVAQHMSNPQKISLFIYCDEAARLVNSADTSISQFIGLIRGTGVSFVASNQTAEASRPILSNTPHKVLGRCVSATDYDIIGSSIGLTAEQKRWIKIHLKKPGTFLASLGQVEHPFLFNVPNLNFKKTDLLLDHSCPELDSLHVIPAPEFFNWSPFDQDIVVEKTGSPSEQQRKETNSPPLVLSPDELRYLREVVKTPNKPISFYPLRIQMGTGHALKIRKALLKKGYITLEKVPQGQGRGRPSSIVIPTALAHDVVSASQGGF